MPQSSTLANPSASWEFLVNNEPAGQLELQATSTGWAWLWRDKPAMLIDLLGVSSVSAPAPERVWKFGDKTDALAHLMHCCGSAFGGHCALLAPH